MQSSAENSRIGLAAVVAACLLGFLLAANGANAQADDASHPTQQAVAVRDKLIADQEALLHGGRGR